MKSAKAIGKGMLDKISSFTEMLQTPGSIDAKLRGHYFGYYKMVYSLKRMNMVPLSIIDIGAHIGMFSRCAHLVFPRADIFAFEPLSDPFQEMRGKCAEIQRFKCFNVAIGDTSRMEKIYRNEAEQSSSFLEVTDLAVDAYPHIARTRKEMVRVSTLDEIMSKEEFRAPVLMKVDVQGYEKSVFDGGPAVLSKTSYLLCELSLQPMYKGQALFDEVYRFLVASGFMFAGVLDDHRHPRTGEILEIDGLFVKREPMLG